MDNVTAWNDICSGTEYAVCATLYSRSEQQTSPVHHPSIKTALYLLINKKTSTEWDQEPIPQAMVFRSSYEGKRLEYS